jgi:hypothetical protein
MRTGVRIQVGKTEAKTLAQDLIDQELKEVLTTCYEDFLKL